MVSVPQLPERVVMGLRKPRLARIAWSSGWGSHCPYCSRRWCAASGHLALVAHAVSSYHVP